MESRSKIRGGALPYTTSKGDFPVERFFELLYANSVVGPCPKVLDVHHLLSFSKGFLLDYITSLCPSV